MATSMAINISLSNRCNCKVVSTVERNLKAKAISINPRKTFTTFNQPPELGNEFIIAGKIEKSMKGSAKAKPNANIPIRSAVLPPSADIPTNKEPKIGPVHEKDAKESTRAIKNIPTTPPLSAFESAAFTQDDGNCISKAPKKDIPNTNSMRKKKRLNQTLVDISFNKLEDPVTTTSKPNKTCIATIENP